MTDQDKRLAGLIHEIDQRRAQIVSIHASIARAKRFNHGRGAADDRVGLYYAECALEAAQQDLGDELYDEARSMDLERAA